MLRTPIYAIVGARPVKALDTPDGGLAIYSFNWQTGEFDLDIKYLEKIYAGTQDEFEELTKTAFDAYVLKLREERRFLQD